MSLETKNRVDKPGANFCSTAIVFQAQRGWNAGVGELPLLGLIIGAFLGSLIVLMDTQYQTKKAERGEEQRAEHRLRTALFGGPCLALS